MIQLALIAARGTSTAMILSKAQKAGHVITSVINVSEKMFKAAGRDLLKLFRITTGKNAGQLNQRALKGMNHSAATASSTEKTLFAANVAMRGLSGEARRGLRDYLRGNLSKSGLKKLLGAATFASVFPLLVDEDEDAETEYNVLTGQEVPKGGIRQDIEARANRFFDSKDAKRVPDYITDYRAELKTDPYRRALRSRVPEYAVSTLKAVPVHTTVESPEQRAKAAETEAARQYFREWNRRRDMFEATEPSKDRTAMEIAAIRDARYKKVAEPGFGQKLFGLRRSKSEIDRDVRYTDLKMQGRDEEADQYWSDWNTENKAKRDAALGGAGSLTEYTRDAPTRGEEDSPAGKTSFAEDIASAAEKFSTVVKEKLPRKKKGGGRVSSRPKSYRTAKVIKQYAKGGSVRKPNRIK